MGLQLGADTVRLGAFRPCQGMTNDGAVAVIQARRQSRQSVLMGRS